MAEIVSKINSKEISRLYGISPVFGKDHFLFKIKRNPEQSSHLALNLGQTKTGKVTVTGLDRNSYASGILKKGDRMLMINGQKVDDKSQCKRLIVESKGDFTGLLERFKKLRSVDSYVQTTFERPDRTKWKDTGEAEKREIDAKSNVIKNKSEERVIIDPNVSVHFIPSDYPTRGCKNILC